MTTQLLLPPYQGVFNQVWLTCMLFIAIESIELWESATNHRNSQAQKNNSCDVTSDVHSLSGHLTSTNATFIGKFCSRVQRYAINPTSTSKDHFQSPFKYFADGFVTELKQASAKRFEPMFFHSLNFTHDNFVPNSPWMINWGRCVKYFSDNPTILSKTTGR